MMNRSLFRVQLILVLVMGLGGTGTVVAEPMCLNAPSRGLTFVDSEDPGWWAKSAPDKSLVGGGITFNISYLDNSGQGFRDALFGAQRQARFEEALAYVGRLLNITGELDVQVDASQFDGSGFLAAAGTFYYLDPGFSNGIAFARLRTGEKSWEQPEIQLQVDFGWSWYYGTEMTPATNLDFTSVLIHEIMHALGVGSHMGASGESLLATGVYTVWDSFIVRGVSGQALLSGIPPDFVGSASDLLSGDLFFSGVNAYSLYGQGNYPGIYAPSTWAQGSSLAHWDQSQIVGGGVMEPQFAYGGMRRLYEPLDIGALLDMGYTTLDQSQNGFQLAVDTEGQGTVRVSPDYDVYDASTSVSLDATPAAGWVLARWEGNVQDSTEEDTSITMQWHESVQAIFEQGASELELTPDTAVDYGAVTVGSYADTNFTVTNVGAGALTGSASVTGSAYSVVGVKDYDLNENESLMITVRFSPTAAGAQSGSVSFSGGDGSTVSLSGSGAEEEKSGSAMCGPAPKDPASWWSDVLVMALMASGLVLLSWREKRVALCLPLKGQGNKRR